MVIVDQEEEEVSMSMTKWGFRVCFWDEEHYQRLILCEHFCQIDCSFLVEKHVLIRYEQKCLNMSAYLLQWKVS